MRLKTFTAATVREAIALVRAEMGEDAIIVSTQSGAGGRGARVVAALDQVDPDVGEVEDWSDTPPPPAASGDEDVRRVLAYHGTPPVLAERLVRAADRFPGEEPVLALAAALDASAGFQPLADRQVQRPLMLVGTPGVGKTLCAAKLIVEAHRRGRAVVAVSCDTRRAGGIEQLEAFTRILDLPLATAATPQELSAHVAAAAGAQVIIDTTGTAAFDGRETAALRALVAAAAAEPVLVLAAGTDAAEAAESAVAFAALGCRRMLATRLDVARRLGALLAASDAGRLAFAGVGIGPHAAESIGAVNPLSLARLLFSAAAAASGRIPASDTREAQT